MQNRRRHTSRLSASLSLCRSRASKSFADFMAASLSCTARSLEGERARQQQSSSGINDRGETYGVILLAHCSIAPETGAGKMDSGEA